MPDTTWSFRSTTDDNVFTIENTRTEKFLFVERPAAGIYVEGSEVQIDSDDPNARTEFKRKNEDAQGYFALVLAESGKFELSKPPNLFCHIF